MVAHANGARGSTGSCALQWSDTESQYAVLRLLCIALQPVQSIDLALYPPLNPQSLVLSATRYRLATTTLCTTNRGCENGSSTTLLQAKLL